VTDPFSSAETELPPAALEGVRVLDVSGPMGNYCGKMFADLGADVILVEPPRGNPLRREPPFIEGRPGIERSLTYAYHNTSKRGITLDLDTPSGQALLRSLAATADLVIETEMPGVMALRGLEYEALAALKPGLVVASITAFGQSGPYAQYHGQDIVALALGGLLYLGGYPDVAPTRVYGNQAVLCANMYGAVAAMIAVLEAEVSGSGQHVDVSMQECVVMGLENAAQFYDLEGTIRKRTAGEGRFAGHGMFECRDGYVYMLAGGIGENRFWGRTVTWLMDENVEGAQSLQAPEWTNLDFLRTPEAKRTFKELFTRWSRTKTKAEIFHEGQRRHLPIAAVNSPADVLENRQLQYRGFFAGLAHHLRDEPMVAPGAPYRLSETPWRIQRPAPRLGEHNAEVYESIGIDGAALARLYGAGVV
jgi:benzylsuccinate CoA-transferase BbsE subunit